MYQQVAHAIIVRKPCAQHNFEFSILNFELLDPRPSERLLRPTRSSDRRRSDTSALTTEPFGWRCRRVSRTRFVRRATEFALTIIELYNRLEEQTEYVISKQLLRSGTSVGANVEEAIAAESRQGFHPQDGARLEGSTRDRVLAADSCPIRISSQSSTSPKNSIPRKNRPPADLDRQDHLARVNENEGLVNSARAPR